LEFLTLEGLTDAVKLLLVIYFVVAVAAVAVAAVAVAAVAVAVAAATTTTTTTTTTVRLAKEQQLMAMNRVEIRTLEIFRASFHSVPRVI